MASLDEELDEDLLASRSWLAKLGGRRLQAPKARGPAPSVARWLADRGALTAKTERPSASRVMPVLPGAPAVHLLGAKTARRRGKCRLHRVLAGKGSEEFKEDLEALSLEDSLTLPPLRSEKVAAGKILEQFAHGASIGYGSVFCTGQDVPPGLHPQGKKRTHRPSMMRVYSGNSMCLSQSLAVSEGKRRESMVSLASYQLGHSLEELEVQEEPGASSPIEKFLAEEEADKLMALPFQDMNQEGPMLPWEPARHFLKPGSIATVHTSRAQSARVLSERSERSGPPKESAKLHGHTWSTGPWLNRLPDRKWHLRQASISASVASRAYPGRPVVTLKELGSLEAPGSPRLGSMQTVEYMHFQGWSLDDDYACTLFRQIRLQELCMINLSDNRLTENFVNFLLEVSEHQPLQNLHSLHLAKNQLGNVGGQAVAKLLETVKCPLQHLDISDNAIGDAAAAQICDSLRQACRLSLQGLSMAKNQLGAARFGTSLQALLPQAVHLQALDLHWNKIDAGDASAIFQGLKTNSRRKGHLWCLNLAWNCIGLRCQGSSGSCSCELCNNCSKAVKTLASVFSECDTLFHLDLSYNSLSSADCEVFAEALRANHTLFGLHLAGNGAYVDDIGMVQVELAHGAPHQVEELLQRERVRRQLDGWVRSMPQQLRPERMGRFVEEVKLAEPFSPSLRRVEKSDVFSEGDLGFEKAWLGVHAKVQPALFSSRLEEVSARESCCWICENWVEQEVCYIPGWSGPMSGAEVQEVFAYFSVDGYSRPSRLSRRLDRFWARDFAQGHEAEAEWLREPYLENGRVICFRGSRMLPPSYERIQVIFQVNQQLCCAKHLPVVALFSETYIQLHGDGRQNPQDPCPPLPIPLDKEAIKIFEANEIKVHLSAKAIFEQRAGDALFLLEDPRLRSTGVAPRTLSESVEKRPWSFGKSIFKDYARDAKIIISECFYKDYALTRLDRLWKKLQKDRRCDVASVLTLLESQYEAFLAAYGFESMMDCSGKSCGLSLATSRLLMGSDGERYLQGSSPMFTSRSMRANVTSVPSRRSKRATELSEGNPRIPRSAQAADILKARSVMVSQLDETHPLNEGFNFGKADAIYTAVLVDLDHLDSKAWKGLPADGLARFQFLEVIVNCAMSSETFSPVGTLRHWIKCLGLGQQVMKHRRMLHAAIFTEDFCHCMRRNLKMLQDVYNTYQKRFRLPTEPSLMSYSAFVQFLEDCKVPTLEWPDFRMAFALGKELCVEQHRSLRHMVLSWSEFLVCTAAAVYLSGDFPIDQLADRLLDFLLDSLPEALRAGRAAEMEEAGYLVAGGDPQTVKLVALLTRIFTDADEDGSGWLTVHEFVEAVQQPRVMASLEELGVVVGDVKLLFVRMDVDDSGEISLREFIEGLLKLRQEMIVLDKGIRAMRKAFFKLETKYGTGQVTKEHFMDYVRNPRNADELKKKGISESDISDLWAAAQQAKKENSTITAEALVAGYMDLHLEKGRIIRAMNFLNSIFKVADVDGSGALSKEEVGKYLCRQEVTDKLASLKLFVPDWLEMFDAMDVDGDGDLTWAELSTAMQRFWAQVSHGDGTESVEASTSLERATS